MARVETTWDQLSGGANLPTGETNTYIVRRNRAEVVEVDERQFLATGHVLLPAPHPVPEDPETRGISGLSILAHALRYADDNADRVLLVAAHADLPGDAAAPSAAPSTVQGAAVALSARRAENVLALLKGDRDAWAQSCEGSDHETLQHLLTWAAGAHGVDCDPGSISGVNDEGTRRALTGFRRFYGGEEPDPTELPSATEDDYAAFFDLYEASIADHLEIEESEMAQAYAKVQYQPPEKIACGALWPTPSGRLAQELRSASKRRVDLIFFETAEEIPDIEGVEPVGFDVYGHERLVRKLYLPPEIPPTAVCVRMTGMFFDTNKCFLLPTAMDVMRHLVHLHDEHPAGEILIVGHTDTTGEPSYNDPLSLERAQAVAAFLLADVDAWVAFYDNGVAAAKRWGEHEDTEMLGALPDGAQHTAAPEPIRSYQQSRGLKDDNIAGPNTRRQLIGDYMALDNTTLPAGVTLTPHGCGENFPYVPTGDGEESAPNRRVEMFMFKQAADPPPPGDNSASGSKEYPMWRRRSITTHSYSAFGLTIDSIDSPHFAPGHEMLEIAYSFVGVTAAELTRLRLHVWAASPKTLLGSVEIPAPYAGTLSWDGRYESPLGPEIIGLKHGGSFLIHLDAETEGATSAGSRPVSVKVLPAEVELRSSDHGSLLPAEPLQRKAVSEFVQELDDGERARVTLDSSLFKISSAEMNDNASFLTYMARWQDGPSLPFLVKVSVKTKGGDKVHSPEVSDGGRLLFDMAFEDSGQYDGSLSNRQPHSEAETFLKNVVAYETDSTSPPGYATHSFFGGLRGSDTPRFQEAAPHWPLAALTTRTWATRVECHYDGELDADCGVYFVNGRMAGDVHKLSAYYEGADDLDVEEDAPLQDLDAERKSKTIAVETWRRVFVSGNSKSGSGTTELDIPALTQEYKKAAVLVEPRPGLTVTEIRAAWRTHYKAEIDRRAATDKFVKYAAQDDPGAYPVRYKSFSDFEDAAEDAGESEAAIAFFGAADEDAYRAKCDQYAYRIYSKVVRNFPLGDDGLNFFKFGANGDHNQWEGSYTAGIAPAITGFTGRTKAVFFVFKADAGTDTLIHEVGHLVFLAHAPGHFNAGEQPAGYQPDAHDEDDVCTMSYANHKHGLCGLCLLKLSGWDYLKVHKDGSIS